MKELEKENKELKKLIERLIENKNLALKYYNLSQITQQQTVDLT